MNSAVPAPLDDAAIIRALQACKAEAAAGRMTESDQLLARLAQQSPHHPAVLNELGVRMLNRGAAEQAHALFVRATSADPRHPSLWANLASSHMPVSDTRRAQWPRGLELLKKPAPASEARVWGRTLRAAACLSARDVALNRRAASEC